MDELRANWERLGEHDPLWAVLTDPSKRGGRWTPSAFLASGETEIAVVFGRLARFGLRPSGQALDFGCGAGRLTQALATRFDVVYGVDISTAMLTQAASLNPPANVAFEHNTTGDLCLFQDDNFDFVYSSIVLQHMPSTIALGYIREFARITKPNGTIVFQAPDEQLPPAPPTVAERLQQARVRLALGTRLRGRRASNPADGRDIQTLEAHPTPEALIRVALAESGAELMDIAVTNSLAADFNGELAYASQLPSHGWVSKQYTAVIS
jgi:trans-aconitate methyltransferase